MLIDKFRDLRRIFFIRNQEYHTIIIRYYIEEGEVPCRRHKNAVVIIYKIINSKEARIRHTESFQKNNLIHHPFQAEHFDNCRSLFFFRNNRFILGNNITHFLFDIINKRIIYSTIIIVYSTEISAGNGVFDTEGCVRQKVGNSFRHHHTYRALINPQAGRGRAIDKLNIFRFVHSKIQTLHFVIYSSGDNIII